AALESAREATRLADDNALAWARRAELELATADAAAGAASARKALLLAPETPRARSLAAFARLMQGESAGATEDFQQIISESDADPLARFGLGLALMRQGQTAAGRREVEIAGLLDPSNAELRSYLGRAYLEEDRSKVAGDQFDLARRLDPASPTPWYFEAFRQLREGEPLAAIRNADEALARNDNRAVIRPSVLIDQDRAARSASLGAAYQQVGFVGASEIIALQALQDDPQSPATHRLLADAYADTPRFEGARLSELLQANLRQPIGAWPLAPQFVMSPLPLFDGPRAVTPEEATALFDRKPTRLAATLGAGNNDTRAGSLLASHAWERGQVSFGTFDYQNASINARMAETRVAGSRADLRLALTPATLLLAEYRHTERSGGSTSQGLFESGPLKTLQNVLNDLGRIALRHTLSASEDLVLEANTQRVRTRDQDLLITDLALDSAGDIRTRGLSLAYSRNTPGHALALGGSVFRMTYDGSATASGFAQPSVHTTSDRDSVFSYGQWRIHPALTLHGGAEYARLALPESTHSERINSKLGIVATPREGTTLRGAFFQGTSGSKFDRESLAPTQFAGFNQVFDDMAGSRWRRAAVAVDQRFAGGIRAGLELSERRLSSLLGPQLAPWHESLHRAHISIPVGDRFALSAEWRRETFRYEGSEVLSNNPHTLRTDLLPLRLWSRLGSVDTLLEHWVVRQNGKQTSQSSDPMTGPFTTEASARSTFTVTNLRASRPLSGKHLSATLGIYNLFDQQVVMHNADRAGDPRPPLFYPRRTVLLQASLRF
ncbi:TonB-dependent receptor, partial [Zoogloea sp.]|uniref:TonB-dependent receptor n=1 Tax=Zoogloea sp. TaxID=49181 RepID=UPI00261C5616